MKNSEARIILQGILQEPYNALKIIRKEHDAISKAIETLERSADIWGQENFVCGLFIPNYEEPKSCQDCEWYVSVPCPATKWKDEPFCSISRMKLTNEPLDRPNECPLALVMIHEDEYYEMKLEGVKGA